MSLPKAFYEGLATRTNDSLIEVIALPNEYLPEAIEAARAELMKRGITQATLDSEIRPKQEAAEKVALHANEPLEWPMRIFCLVLPLFSFRIGRSYLIQGQKRKSNECCSWGTLGIVLYLVAVGTIEFLDKY